MSLGTFLIWTWCVALALFLIGFIMEMRAACRDYDSHVARSDDRRGKHGCLASAIFLRIGLAVTLAACIVKLVIKFLI